MLTIQNYNKIDSCKFFTNSNEQEWVVAVTHQTPDSYVFAVMPKDNEYGIYVISKAITYTLKRIKKNRRGYEMTNSKNNRVALVTESNLTFDNFILELLIQTALNTNRC